MAPADGDPGRLHPSDPNAPTPSRRSLRACERAAADYARMSDAQSPIAANEAKEPVEPNDPGAPAPAPRRSTVHRSARPGATRRLAAALDQRRNRRSLTVGQKVFGMTAVAAMVLTGAIVAAGTSSAETAYTRAGFSPTGTWAWYNDTSLGRTDSVDQYAQAQIGGLLDSDHNAGFFMRYSSKRSRVLVAVSGTGWKIEPSTGRILTGTFAHNSKGTFRAELEGPTVRLLWDGAVVTTQKIDGSYRGKSVVASVWQSTPTVRMTALEASSLTGSTRTPVQPAATQTSDTQPSATKAHRSESTGDATSTSASASTPGSNPRTSTSSSADTAGRSADTGVASGARQWLSGASGDDMAGGGFDRWRATPAGIAGTWDDSAAAQLELWSICGGQYAHWDKALDLAIGGIYLSKGDSWSAAASGAYNERWRSVLTKTKSCWGSRDPGKLFIRFAHEANLDSSEWRVRSGEEADFAAAFTQFSNVRYEVFPGVKLVYCPNDGSSGGMGDVRTMFPGRDSQGRLTADVYGADSYNMWPHTTTSSQFDEKINSLAGDGAPLGLERHRRLAEQHGVPFIVGEWSNNGDPSDGDGGGESPEYVQDFYHWARAHAGDVNHPRPGQLLYEVHFNLWKQYQFWPQTMQPQTASAYQALPWGH